MTEPNENRELRDALTDLLKFANRIRPDYCWESDAVERAQKLLGLPCDEDGGVEGLAMSQTDLSEAFIGLN